MKPSYRILDPSAPDGDEPYSEEELLDLLEAGELSPDALCEEIPGGRRCRAGELFEVIGPDSRDASAVRTEEEEEEEEDEDEDPPVPWRPAPMVDAPPAPSRSGPPVRLLYAGHPALLTFWRSLGVGLLAIAGGWFAGRWDEIWLGAGLLAGGLWIVAVLLVRSCTDYRIDTRRVETSEGIVAKSSREIRIRDIRAINVTRSGIAGLVGIGTVEFASAGSGEQDVTFRQVAGAERIKLLVRRLQEE